MTFLLATPCAVAPAETPTHVSAEHMSAVIDGGFASVIAQIREKHGVDKMPLTCHGNGGFNGQHESARKAAEMYCLSDEMSEGDLSQRRRRAQHDEKCSNNDLMAGFSGSGSLPQRRHVTRLAVLAAQLHNGFERMVRVLLDDPVEAGSRVTVSIPLEGIGEIRLDVRMVQKEVFVVAHGPNDEIVQILALGIGELDARLSAAGFHLARVDVVTSH